MATLQSSRVRLHPSTSEEVRLVREELRVVLESPQFTTSKRYPALLQYVVEMTLEGKADELKERTLGIEVFHRRSDYDTNSDTIVRFAAGEVRKRLALIYHESESEHPLQIALVPGSYIPDFLVLAAPEHAAAIPPQTPTADQPAKSVVQPQVVPPPTRLGVWLVPVAALALLALIGIGWLLYRHMERPRDAVDLFWAPIVQGPQPAVLCPGASVFSRIFPYGATRAVKDDEYPYISMAQAGTITRLATLFGERHVQYSLLPSSATTLTDIRQHPTVMIGVYNNDWTIRLVNEELRYRFAPQSETAIYDSLNPSVRWHRPAEASYDEGDDYAVIARFYDKLTESMMIVIGGLGKNGTEAAAQFVLSDQYLALLNQPQSKGWATKNVELVIRSKVVGSKTGAPSIEAIYVW